MLKLADYITSDMMRMMMMKVDSNQLYSYIYDGFANKLFQRCANIKSVKHLVKINTTSSKMSKSPSCYHQPITAAVTGSVSNGRRALMGVMIR